MFRRCAEPMTRTAETRKPFRPTMCGSVLVPRTKSDSTSGGRISARYRPKSVSSVDEPAIGPLSINRASMENIYKDRWIQPDWVIAGGESGSGARTFQVEWARSLRIQCQQPASPSS